jgi:hypothetical protein
MVIEYSKNISQGKFWTKLPSFVVF